jgi:hypothetical protein
VHAADLLEPPLQAQPIEAVDRQRRENSNALMQHPVRILERKRDLGRGAFGFGWIGNAPMRVIGWPGHTGQTSPAALSQTVKAKSSAGAPGWANSFHDFERKPDVS